MAAVLHWLVVTVILLVDLFIVIAVVVVICRLLVGCSWLVVVVVVVVAFVTLLPDIFCDCPGYREQVMVLIFLVVVVVAVLDCVTPMFREGYFHELPSCLQRRSCPNETLLQLFRACAFAVLRCCVGCFALFVLGDLSLVVSGCFVFLLFLLSMKIIRPTTTVKYTMKTTARIMIIATTTTTTTTTITVKMTIPIIMTSSASSGMTAR